MRVENINVLNSSDETINLIQDESVLLLRKIVKMLESNTVVDANMRQRVIIDSATGVYGPYNIGTGGTNTPTAAIPISANSVSYAPTWAGPIDPRWTNIEQARIAYNTKIRANIKFT